MTRLKNLNVVLAGLLSLGVADLAWLGGWLAPAVLVAQNDEVHAEPAPQDTPDTPPANEALVPPDTKEQVALSHTDDTPKAPEPEVVPEEAATEVVVALADTAEESTDIEVDEVEVENTEVEVEVEVEAEAEVEEVAQTPVSIESVVLFGSNADVVAGHRTKQLRKVAKAIIKSGVEVRVVGHADERGTEEYNESLAMRRAENVSVKLQAFGVPEQLIHVEAQGERQPLANATLARQRRVEIQMY